MKKRIIKGVMAFVLCCICVLTIGLCCGKKASALENNIFSNDTSFDNVTSSLTYNSLNDNIVFDFQNDEILVSNNNYNLPINLIDIYGFDNSSIYCCCVYNFNSVYNYQYDLYLKCIYSDITLSQVNFPILTINASYGKIRYFLFDSRVFNKLRFTFQRAESNSFQFYFQFFKLNIVDAPIKDSFGNIYFDNQIYYSQSNYNDYGTLQYNEGLNSYYEGVEPMVLTNSTYYGGSSFVGINNDIPTRLYYSFDYGTDYLTFGGLNLSGGFDKYLITVGFKDDYSITKVSFTPATSVVACIVNGNKYTEASYDGSYYYFNIPHIVSSDIVLELAPSADSTNLSKNIKIEGIADIPTLVYNAYNRGYNYGLELNQEKIETLEQQLNDGFTLFTPVTAFLNMTLAEFTLFDTTFKLTFGLLLSFILGLTAIFIVVKIFK